MSAGRPQIRQVVESSGFRQGRQPGRVLLHHVLQRAIGVEAEGLRHQLDGERQLVELRGQGLSWEEVASYLGGTAGARRNQLARALDRVAAELGIDKV